MVSLTWTSDRTEAPIGGQAVTGRPGQAVRPGAFRKVKNVPAESRSNRAGEAIGFLPILKTDRSSNDAGLLDSCGPSHSRSSGKMSPSPRQIRS